MSEENTQILATLHVRRGAGDVVEGEAPVSAEGFSSCYDLNRRTGEITRPGHALRGANIHDKICFFPTANGGIAAGWAFNDIKGRSIAHGTRVLPPGWVEEAGRAVFAVEPEQSSYGAVGYGYSR